MSKMMKSVGTRLALSAAVFAALSAGVPAAAQEGTFGGLPTITPQGRQDMQRRQQTIDPRHLSRERVKPSYVVVDKGGLRADARRDSYDSISAAIEAVAVGGVVYIMPGIYEENIELHKAVSLQGDRGPGVTVEIRPQNASKPCLSFEPLEFGQHALVSNITFRPSWKRAMGVDSAATPKASAPAGGHDLAQGVDFASQDTPCIDVRGGQFTLIESTVDGEGHHRGDLVSITGGAALLEKNKITGGHRGIAVKQAHAVWDRAMLIDNIVSKNLVEGVHLDGVANMLATGNLINENGRGLVYSGQGAATLIGNKILNNASHGVLLDQDARQVLVRLNQIWSNKGDGIKIFNASGLIQDNDISGNRGYEISTIGHLQTIPTVVNDVGVNQPSPKRGGWNMNYNSSTR